MSPYANFNRLCLDQLYLPFLEPLLHAIAACNQRGANYVAVSGYRDFKEQAKLYFQGRTATGPKVTNARPGYSPHNYGLAVDFARLEGKQYLPLPKEYLVLGEEAKRAGLLWGGGWGDSAHVQLPGYASAAELSPLKAIYEAHPEAPLSAVWECLKPKPSPPPKKPEST